MTHWRLVNCAKRLDILTADHIPDRSDFVISVKGIIRTLTKKYDRLLTACMPRINKTAGVIGLFSNRTMPWYFFGYERDTRGLEQLRVDLGLPSGARALWWHTSVDMDGQEVLDRPSAAYVQKMKGKTKRGSPSPCQECSKKQKRADDRRRSTSDSSVHP